MSKLKRQRKRKDPLPNLNDSDDFISTATTLSSRTRSQPSAQSSSSSDPVIKAASVTASDPAPPASTSVPCPLCRKAVSDQAGHLKVSQHSFLRQELRKSV